MNLLENVQIFPHRFVLLAMRVQNHVDKNLNQVLKTRHSCIEGDFESQNGGESLDRGFDPETACEPYLGANKVAEKGVSLMNYVEEILV